ncbi:M56 family metallopeptidase [Roseivirga sp.]|uniref:M56 family metallopeptidase n=1 Tax=Roseivirga sp. TaxID=1964215 RepID=UPI002B277185|nr:M56 family metallopeptidase [Roseivirga sp.]
MKGFINPQWAEALGLTLFDSLWQGALVLIASFVVLLFMRKASPAKRYTVVLVAILILPLLSIVTFTQHFDTTYAITPVANSISSDNSALFSLDLSETFNTPEQAAAPLTFIAKWKAWTSQNANMALVIWLLGAFLFTVRMLGGFYFLNRLKSKASPIVDSAWLEKMSVLCKSLKIKGKVLLKHSERVSSPLVMGVIKPVIIFPMGLIQALPTDEIEAILVHELAHIKRKDFLINIVINLLHVVYFFHPAFWWLKTQLDAEREYHCDDIALNQLGKKLTLIRALTNASEFQGHKFQPALAFAGKKNQLLNRVKRIVYHKPQMNWLSGFMSLGILVLSFALMSQNAKQEDKPSMADLQEDDIENLMQEPALQDTTKVNKAILELLNPNSKVTVKTDASGKVSSIMNDKTEITGQEFEAYKAAYNQIHKFSEERQKTKEELQELAEMVNVKNRKIDVVLKARDIANAKKAKEYNQRIDEELEKRAQQHSEEMAKVETKKAQNEVNIARIRAETRKVEREIPQTQVALKELEKQLKASGKTDTALVNQYKKQLDELNEHWRTLNSYSSNLRKYENEVNQYLEKMNSSIDFSAPKIRYQFMGKILGEEEMGQYKLAGLRVSEIIEDYPIYDEKEQKEIKVKLVKLGKLQANSEQNKDTLDVYFRQPNNTVIRPRADDVTIYYVIDGELKKDFNPNNIDPSQIETLSVIKSKSTVIDTYPELKDSNPALIIIQTKKGSKKSTSGITMRSPFKPSYLDFSTVNFDDEIDNSQRTNFTIKRLEEDNAIIEIDGELKPDMTVDQIKALDLMNVKSIQIIKNDKMYEYHKKRKLKGYDALIRIVTK